MFYFIYIASITVLEYLLGYYIVLKELLQELFFGVVHFEAWYHTQTNITLLAIVSGATPFLIFRTHDTSSHWIFPFCVVAIIQIWKMTFGETP